MEVPVETNIETKIQEDNPLSLMQKQFEELTESMTKVRKKLFGELGEMKKTFVVIQKENEDLKSMLEEFRHVQIHRTDRQECGFFDVSKHQEATG